MATKIISTGEEKKAFFNGITKHAQVVGSTLGAAGNTVGISLAYQTDPFVTKDGVTVSKHLVTLEDEQENVGSMFMYQAARKTVEAAGDGTTSTVVLANAIITEGNKVIASGARPQDVKRGIDLAVKSVVAKLKETSEAIEVDSDKLLSIATISANNDAELGGIIADAYKKVGKDGMLTIENSNTVETYVKIVDGFEFNRGYIHPYFVNTPEKMQTLFENPYIFVTEYTINSMKEILGVCEKMVQTGRPIVIIATDVEGEAYGSLLQSKVKQGLKVCIIKAPNVYKNETLDDIAVLTGATVIRNDAGIKLKSADLQHMGSCDKIVITDKKTSIIGGKGEPEAILKRKSEILIQIEEAVAPEQKLVRETRLAKLSGCVGVIHVGAITDVERKEKYDRVDDAVRAVKSAIEEGISCGGGVALIRCAEATYMIDPYNQDITSGINIVRKALEAPLRQMIKNAGGEDSIVGQVKAETGDVGYNVKSSTMQNLKENGVVDPTKVIRVSLENAASVAGVVLTSEYLLIDMK